MSAHNDGPQTPKILIFTYSDHGQSNPMLSIASSLALLRPDIQLHIASFSPLDKRFPEIQALIDRERHLHYPETPRNKDIVFHLCKGVTNMQGYHLYGGGIDTLPHEPGLKGSFQAARQLGYLVAPLEGREYLESYEQCRELIQTIRPAAVVVDILFRPALDACRMEKQRFIVLNTISYKECAAMDQPGASLLTKFPASCSAYPYPLPWYLIPFNIFINLWIGYTVATTLRFKALDAYRKEYANIPFGFYEFKIPDAPYLCPQFPETDFPFYVPEHVTSCGPLILPFRPVEEEDPELAGWLDKGPTILVNLGSHTVSDETNVRELATGLRVMFASGRVDKKTQVLWKVKVKVKGGAEIEEILGKEIRDGRVKVVDWIKAAPVSVLVHRNAVCTVHHGGANSYNEGIWTGTPHVVLPVWYDTYDFASRVEYLGVGVYGSKTCAPNVASEEFGTALMRVVGSGEESEIFRAKARGLRDICKRRGSGREIGAKRVLELAGL
ncbi:hypothetical protein V5O48_011770 [Marasmius crinis-equi]|uniref:Erythromycin biosynthesis protein CIII-like C-terminal domain-containing protein n=1 Tax=Marasmius crinis-equi TaxID=585013 RepID=A0ABR3F4Q0_9AGAR